jgi:hypothetical protein
MWGPAIVGFGDYHYKYDTGREADWFEAGFSPRKQALTLYLMGGKSKELLSKLGAHSSGVGLLMLGLGGLIDTFVSKIILEEDRIHIVSIARRRSFPRSDFESAKVEGGHVCLKRLDGKWLVLPGTGSNALSQRNTIHAWIKKQKGQEV